MRSANPASGVLATITLPAIPGVAHVLESLKARFININQAGSVGTTIRVSTGGTVVWTYPTFVTGAGANIIAIDDVEALINLTCPVGLDLKVEFGAAPAANYQQAISITGRDI